MKKIEPEELTPDAAMARAEELLNTTFENRSLLLQALTHRSYAQANLGPDTEEWGNNEKLEWMGDSVLRLVVSDILLEDWPEAQEHGLTAMRDIVTSRTNLNKMAVKAGFADCLLKQKGMGNARHVYGDLFEALSGALYFDQGLPAVRQHVLRWLGPEIIRLGKEAVLTISEPKQKLERWAKKRGFQGLPVYEVLEATHEDEIYLFRMRVCVDGLELSQGTGSTKKEAELAAASAALERWEKLETLVL